MERARPPMPAPRMASVKGCFGLSPLLERSSGSKEKLEVRIQDLI
jgi:hypothetical protein